MMAEIKIQSLKNSIDFQEGSVVSQTVLKKDTGNVSIFAFDQGQGLSEHTAPFDAMVYILEGKAEIKISGHPYMLEAGESIIMPANQPHALQGVEKFKMMLIMIKDK